MSPLRVCGCPSVGLCMSPCVCVCSRCEGVCFVYSRVCVCVNAYLSVNATQFVRSLIKYKVLPEKRLSLDDRALRPFIKNDNIYEVSVTLKC